MAAHSPFRLVAAALAGLALLGALLLALFDWMSALVLIGALALGWALVAGTALLRVAYRTHRGYVLGVAGAIVLALLMVLRPTGDDDEVEAAPVALTSYGAELWTNRLATTTPGFIVRERMVRAATGDAQPAGAVDGRANVDAVVTGPLMREIRFAPGAEFAAGGLALERGALATVVVNPIEGGVVHHARGATLSTVELPMGDVVTATYDELPRVVRVAYLVGAGRALAPLAALVTPLRRMPPAVAILFFAALGVLLARAWYDAMVAPLVGRAGRRRPPAPKPGTPGATFERAPLVPRRS